MMGLRKLLVESFARCLYHLENSGPQCPKLLKQDNESSMLVELHEIRDLRNLFPDVISAHLKTGPTKVMVSVDVKMALVPSGQVQVVRQVLSEA